MTSGSQVPELEAAGHSTSAIGKGRDACAHAAAPLICSLCSRARRMRPPGIKDLTKKGLGWGKEGGRDSVIGNQRG